MSTKQENSEQELLLQLREGNEKAFTEIYYLYWKLMFYVASNKLNNPHDAEEVVQEVFADLWRRRAAVRVDVSLKAFLAAAVKFQVYALMARRYRESEKKAQLEVVQQTTPSPDEQLQLKFLYEQFYDLTQQLPEKCRLVYRLSREEGLTNKEIAGHLDISEKTVESQMTKALKKLRGGLKLLFTQLFSF
ncbi:RNA polymerase sigma factor [Filimonas effusa]|uniref:RNA polymerase sigma factor n=1 Tax=Filimonas effusa TaxID=2508721 RepID=UPI0013E99018|nr:RNA polymerase sigma-70 factor [Filimonas effusa]